jgi:hypothetical protein
MLLKKNLNRRLPNFGPGWRMEDVYNVKHHPYNTTESSEGGYNYANDGKPQQQQDVETTTQVMIGSFDVLLFHIPIGWIQDYNSINNDTLMETVLLARELFGVKTVVFNVPSFTNNIISAQQLQSLRAVQNRVAEFANNFVPPPNTTNQHVLTLRMDRLMDETMEWNARLMGMNVTEAATTTNSGDEKDWRLVSFVQAQGRKKKYTHHVAQVCAALPGPSTDPNKPTCTPNHFSLDGMHPCMETMGGRLFAGLGCVLGCVYNNNNDVTDDHHPGEICQHQSLSPTAAIDHEKDRVLSCANACNDRYLSLRSVENEVVE